MENIQPPSARDQIGILLEEYRTLRSEILNRSNHGFQVLAAAGAVFVWLASQPFDTRFWVVLFVAIVVICGLLWLINSNIYMAAHRLRRIEASINSLAGVHLLEWETKWGAADILLFGICKRLLIRKLPLDTRKKHDNLPV